MSATFAEGSAFAFMVNGLWAELGKAVAPYYNLPLMELREKIIQLEETHSRYNKGASSSDKSKKCTYCHLDRHLVTKCRKKAREQHLNLVGNLLKPNVSTVVPAKPNPPIAASMSTTTQHMPFKCFICGSEQHRARDCSFYGRSKAYMVIEDDEEEALPIEEDEDNTTNPTETIQLVGSPKTLERKCHPPMVLMDLGTITEDALLDTGASCNLSTNRLYDYCKAAKIPMVKVDQRITGIGHYDITADKYLAKIPFKIGPHYFRANFLLIPGIKQITLLGRDFISKYGLLIHCQQHQWSHKGRSYPFISTEELSNTIHNLNEAEAQRWDTSLFPAPRDVYLKKDEGVGITSEQHNEKVSPFTYVIADRNGTTIGKYHVSDIYPTKNNHVKEGAKISSLFNEEPKPPEDVQESPPPQDIEEPKEDQSITKKTRCGQKIFMPVRFKQ
ncbi:hypothetical protein CHUAL_009701 [Chamberlinius hualienensis]